jgi:DNA invertase Pin-like site-specific DNA recombinase
MAQIDDAIAAIESLELGEEFTYTEIADRFSVSRTTLSRRHRACQRPRDVKDSDQRIPNLQQEHELVLYITD